MIELIAMCAPDVSPQTIQEIIRVESSGNPLSINVNRLPISEQPRAQTTEEAVSVARYYIEAGYSVDMGLMQVNSENLAWLGIGLDNLQILFNPCANITAGAAILSESYQRAALVYGPGQTALQAALSAYNTGNFLSGFSNGYVARFYGLSLANPSALAGVQSQAPATAIEAMRSPTGISWTPPEGYYSSSTPNQEGEQMDNKHDTPPSKAELDAIDATAVKASYMDSVPGLVIEFEPDETDRMGAFEEDALSLEDAMEASSDPREVK